MIKKWDILGAALATSVSYAYECIVHYLFIKKITNGEYPFNIRFYLKPFMVMTIGIVMFYSLESVTVVRWICATIVAGYIILTIYKRKSIF